MDRLAHLNQLLALPVAASDLSQLAWDSDAPQVQLEATHIVNALSKFVAGEASVDQIEAWANAIECRDDIAYSPQSPVGVVLHELANPLLTEPLSQQSAQRLIASLNGAAT